MAKPLLDSSQQRKVEALIRCWNTNLTWEKLTKALVSDLNIKISRQSLSTYLGIKEEYKNKKAELRGVSVDISRHIKQSDIKKPRISGPCGHHWMLLDVELVEAAGIEPASVSPLPRDLHA